MWRIMDPVIAIGVYFILYMLGYWVSLISQPPDKDYFSLKVLIVNIFIGLIIAISSFYILSTRIGNVLM